MNVLNELKLAWNEEPYDPEWENISFEYVCKYPNAPNYEQMLAFIAEYPHRKQDIEDFTVAWAQMDRDFSGIDVSHE